VFDDGGGPSLFVGGEIDTAGGVPSAAVARWKPAPPSGNVNGAAGGARDVLFANGAPRAASAAIGAPIDVRLDRSPSGPAVADYVLWAWAGAPYRSSPAAFGGTTLGCTANPTALNSGLGHQPALCGLGGLGAEFCGSGRRIRLPRTAPFDATREHGLARRAVVTLQGVIEDAAALNATGLSVTNTVVLRVE
jgi:hypothetical protein